MKLCIKRPWNSGNLSKIEDAIDFWGARGFLKLVLNKLVANREVNIISKDHGEILFNDIDNFTYISPNSLDLYKRLKMLMQIGVISPVEFNVEIIDESADEVKNVNINELSEGEKQLSNVLCLIENMKEENVLFLFDEIDAFLHPSWQREFTNSIRSIDIRGQVIFTTHSPLTVGKMYKDDITHMERGQSRPIDSATINRSAGDILEEVFGVSPRPEDISDQIYDAKKLLFANKVDEARFLMENLINENRLSSEDPFIVTFKEALEYTERQSEKD